MTGLLLAQVETQSAIIGGIVGLSIILARVIEKLVEGRKPNGEEKLYAKMDSLLTRLVEREEQVLKPIHDAVIWLKDVHLQKDLKGRFVWHGYEAVDLLQEIVKAERTKVAQFQKLLDVSGRNAEGIAEILRSTDKMIHELAAIKQAIVKNGQNGK